MDIHVQWRNIRVNLKDAFTGAAAAAHPTKLMLLFPPFTRIILNRYRILTMIRLAYNNNETKKFM